MRTRPGPRPGSRTPRPANRRWTRRLGRRSTGGRQPSGEFRPHPRGSCCAGRGKRRGGARTQETKPRGPAQHGRGGHCRCEPADWARNPTGWGAGPDAESCGFWSAGPMSAGHLGGCEGGPQVGIPGMRCQRPPRWGPGRDGPQHRAGEWRLRRDAASGRRPLRDAFSCGARFRFRRFQIQPASSAHSGGLSDTSGGPAAGAGNPRTGKRGAWA